MAVFVPARWYGGAVVGRKSIRTPELEAEVLRRLSDGEPLTWIARDLGFHHVTWRAWCREDEKLNIAHGRARDDGFDAIAEKALEIADNPLEGVEYTTKADGGTEEKRGDMLGHRKLQIETRLKLLAKWDPRRYGDKLAVGGADDLPPIQTASTEEIARRAAFLLAAADKPRQAAS